MIILADQSIAHFNQGHKYPENGRTDRRTDEQTNGEAFEPKVCLIVASPITFCLDEILEVLHRILG